MAQFGKAVTIAELASMLNAPQDVKAICTSTNINKWSIHKPIHYSSTGPLEEPQFKGMTTEFDKGIIYGLKAGVDNESAANIHAADWSYVGRPQGGIPNSPYRVDDFWYYEKDIKNPSLYGGGLANGQEGIYTNNLNITTQVTWDDRPGIINIGDVFAWNNNTAIDPSNMYLCVLVGNYARAMLAKDAGDIVAPLYYNDVQNKTFAFPEMTSLFTTIGLPLDTELNVSVFIIHKNDISDFKNQWVDMTLAIHLTHKPVTLPMQAGLKMKFRAPGLVYIKNFKVVEETQKGSRVLVCSWTTGPDWELGYAYRILFNITGTGSGITSSTLFVDKSDFSGSMPAEGSANSATAFLSSVMSQFPANITQSTYTIKADFQVQPSEGDSWKTTGEMVTIQILW